MKFLIRRADDMKHKYVGIFVDGDKSFGIPFGAYGYEDMTIHGDYKRRESYLARHHKEDWTNPFSAGSLSRYILWETPSLKDNIRIFKSIFNFK